MTRDFSLLKQLYDKETRTIQANGFVDNFIQFI